MEKFCNVCKQNKDENEFYNGKKLRKSNKNLYEFCCLECFNNLQEEARIKTEQEKILKATTKTKCKNCGETKFLIDMKNKKYCKKCVEENPELKKKKVPSEYKQVSEKECCTCHEIKPIEQFSRNRYHSDGHASDCKDCAKEYNVKYRAANHEKYLEDKRNAYQNDPDRLEKGAKRREENREKIRAWDREYNKKYRSEKTARDNKYKKERRKRDPIFVAYQNVRKVINNYIRNCSLYGKRNSALTYLPKNVFTTIGTCPQYGYELDHIIPLRAFDPNDDEMLKLAHLPENLRWVPGDENLKKTDFIYWELIESSPKLLEIASILRLTKDDDRKYAQTIFPIVDGKFVRRS